MSPHASEQQRELLTSPGPGGDGLRWPGSASSVSPSLNISKPPIPLVNSMLSKAAASKCPREWGGPSLWLGGPWHWDGQEHAQTWQLDPLRQSTTKIRSGQGCDVFPMQEMSPPPSGTGLSGGCHWVGGYPLVSANLAVRVKITPGASFSKIKGDAIANVCRCIQTQMGTSVFNCKWVRTEQMRFPLYLGSKNYRENVPEAETNQKKKTPEESREGGPRLLIQKPHGRESLASRRGGFGFL